MPFLNTDNIRMGSILGEELAFPTEQLVVGGTEAPGIPEQV